ncbi:uncharacterized protein TNCV_4767731 [Trichonephila clavipes]|nr:uncharacterized protein TNCV_4767731 [Trichonephila clavipes]
MLEIEKGMPSPTTETKLTLEAELKTLEEKIKFLEGKMTEFLPFPIALCPHKSTFKAVKRPADPVTKPAKFTAKANKNKSKTDPDFVFPKKTAKIVPTVEKEQVQTKNTFEALKTAKTDAKDVTLPYKIKPIFMRIYRLL